MTWLTESVRRALWAGSLGALAMAAWSWQATRLGAHNLYIISVAADIVLGGAAVATPAGRVVGWIIHLLISTAVAWLIGLVGDRTTYLFAGLIVVSAVWLLNYMLMFTWLHIGPPVSHVATSVAWMTWIEHLVFGAVVGMALWLRERRPV